MWSFGGTPFWILYRSEPNSTEPSSEAQAGRRGSWGRAPSIVRSPVRADPTEVKYVGGTSLSLAKPP